MKIFHATSSPLAVEIVCCMVIKSSENWKISSLWHSSARSLSSHLLPSFTSLARGIHFKSLTRCRLLFMMTIMSYSNMSLKVNNSISFYILKESRCWLLFWCVPFGLLPKSSISFEKMFICLSSETFSCMVELKLSSSWIIHTSHTLVSNFKLSAELHRSPEQLCCSSQIYVMSSSLTLLPPLTVILFHNWIFSFKSAVQILEKEHIKVTTTQLESSLRSFFMCIYDDNEL